jgi:hypothetical protein
MAQNAFGLHNTDAVADGGFEDDGMSQDYKVDLRWEDGGRLTDRTISPDREAAFMAFRNLLAREDLAGQAVAVRFVVDGRSLYFSRFDRPFGEGRILPGAPIRADVDRDEADRLARITVTEATLRERLDVWKRQERSIVAEALGYFVSAKDAAAALERLFQVANSDTGQARRVAHFLMACWNAEELGGFDPADLFGLDRAIGLDIVAVVAFLARQSDAFYFDQFDMRPDIEAVIARWKPNA